MTTTTMPFDVPPAITELKIDPMCEPVTTQAAARPERKAAGPTGASRANMLPDVAYVVLGYVGRYENGVHGYQLGRALSRSPLRVPSMQLGHLYRVLQRLEKAGFVQRHVETESSRLRYRFTVTKKGNGAFQGWLSRIPEGTGQACEQLLERLRFADCLSPEAVLSLIDSAAQQCQEGIEELAAHVGGGSDAAGPYAVALKARLADGRCWLEEVRRLVQEAATEASREKIRVKEKVAV